MTRTVRMSWNALLVLVCCLVPSSFGIVARSEGSEPGEAGQSALGHCSVTTESAKITVSDPDTLLFGYDVDVDQQTALVGAYQSDSMGLSDSGRADVLARDSLTGSGAA
jgi:hypothetical protein